MSYCLTYARMDEILSSLTGRYRIFAPKSNAQKKLVRYGEIHSAAEVVYVCLEGPVFRYSEAKGLLL